MPPPTDAAASATPSAAVARAEDATGAPPASIGGTYAHADGGVLRVEHTAPATVRVVGARDGVELDYAFEMRHVAGAAWAGRLPESAHLHPANRGKRATWTFEAGGGAFTSCTGRRYARVETA